LLVKANLKNVDFIKRDNMRLWSIHPKYLDCQGLIGCWREALLAQNVLLGKTKGYKNHPQLLRFKDSLFPIESISLYLWFIFREGYYRGYDFQAAKICKCFNDRYRINVTSGQIDFEFDRLQTKLYLRDPDKFRKNEVSTYILNKNEYRTGPLKFHKIDTHPIFCISNGPKADWEKG
jgi:hypothetical protein